MAQAAVAQRAEAGLIRAYSTARAGRWSSSGAAARPTGSSRSACRSSRRHGAKSSASPSQAISRVTAVAGASLPSEPPEAQRSRGRAHLRVVPAGVAPLSRPHRPTQNWVLDPVQDTVLIIAAPLLVLALAL